MARQATLVCTANHPGGWNFSTTNSSYDKTITMNIYRYESGKRTSGPMDGIKWKYGNAKDRQSAINAINKCADKIGLAVGALEFYEREQQ